MTPPAGRGGGFLTTRWSLVLRAGEGGSEEARSALEELARGYWPPLYAYVRRRGYDAETSCDLVQGFFARWIERGDVGRAAPDKGRFRAFMLAGLRHFLINEEERARAAKRGGGAWNVRIDPADAEALVQLGTSAETPERAFERAWAQALLQRALERVRAEYAARGRAAVFEALAGHMLDARSAPYHELAEGLGMQEGTLKVAAHRLRMRFRQALRREVLETVADPSCVDDELRALRDALGAE